MRMPEVDVAEQATLLGLSKRGPSSELACAADVVQERAGEQEIAAQARVKLRGLAAKRCDPDRVLEEPAGVSVVPVGTGCRAAPGGKRGSASSRTNELTTAASPGWAISAARNSKNPSSSSASRRSVGVSSDGSASSAGSTAAHLHLEPAAEALDTTEDAHRVAFAEALVEEVDVAPDARLDATARVCELEREIGGARARATPLLLRDREHALYGPVLGELGDRGHVRSL